jgi:WD40 repeat protein
VNIARNADMFKSLGLASAAADGGGKGTRKKAVVKRKAPSSAAQTTPPARQSKRVRNLDTDGAVLPELKEKPQTLAEEQAAVAIETAPFAGQLDAVDHSHSPDENLPEDQAERTDCCRLLCTKPTTARKAGKTLIGTAARLQRLTLSGEDAVVKLCAGRVFSMAVHPRSDTVAVMVGDKYGHLGVGWGPTGGENFAVFHSHVRPVSGILVGARNPMHIHTCSYDGQLRTLDLHAGKILEVASFGRSLTAISGCTGSDTLYASVNDGSLATVDARVRTRDAIVAEFRAHEKKISHVEVNPHDTNLVVTSSNDGMVKVWDARKLGVGKGKSKPLAALVHSKGVTSASWSRGTGRKLLTTCNDDRVRVFNNPTGPSSGKPLQWIHNNHTVRSFLRSLKQHFALMIVRCEELCNELTSSALTGSLAHQLQSDFYAGVRLDIHRGLDG